MPPETDLLTPAETAAYLRLDVEDDGTPAANPLERLLNLTRRQRLPKLQRGRLIRFSRAAVDAWLAGGRR